MKVKLYLKDSPIVREFEVDSHWHEGNVFYFKLANEDTVRIYPMAHVWRLDVPWELSVVKEEN